MTASYHARLQKVLRFIEGHLDEDLSLDRLAAVAAFSKYHFHRQFSAAFGMTVHRYIQLLRLKRAVHRLAFRRQRPVTAIALDSGYDGPDAFSRAFKRRLGQTPSQFREKPRWDRWRDTLAPAQRIRSQHLIREFSKADVKIVDFPETRLAVLSHRGDPGLIGNSVRRFIDWRKSVGLPPRLSATFTIAYDDPDTTPPERFHLDLGAATNREITANDVGIIAQTIPGGRCAVLRHIARMKDCGPPPSFFTATGCPKAANGRGISLCSCRGSAFFPTSPKKTPSSTCSCRSNKNGAGLPRRRFLVSCRRGD